MQQQFRPSFWALWRWGTACGGAIGTALFVISYLLEGPLLFLPTAAVSVANGIVFAVFVWCVPIYLTQEGIRSFNIWGAYRLVRWSEVTETRPINLLGLKYLREYSAGLNWPIWLPLYLSDIGRFIVQVRQHAGTDQGPVTAIERHRA